jgi:hypothetical protein
MTVLRRASGVPHQYGGEEHRGWLPPGAATPLPTPVRNVTLDITIERDEGAGFLLIFQARDDPSFGNDYWFDTLSMAEAAALEWFGVGPDRWEQE